MNEDTGSSSNPISTHSATNTLATKEDVAIEIKKWIMSDQDGNNKSYENAVKHVESKLERPLSCLETTWLERQYVATVLQLWLEKSLKKAFEYLEKYIIQDMSSVLKELYSIHSFGDIRSKESDVASPMRDWCDGECRYLKLILGQEDLFAKTSPFTVSVNCYFNQFKTCCIDKVFSRCLSVIVKEETNGGKQFIADLKDFLDFVNDDKNRQTISEEFQLQNITDDGWPRLFQSLVDKISSLPQKAESGQTGSSSTPEWFQRYQKASSLLNDVGWTQKLEVLTKEICKKFLLPETEIEFKKEDGKQIIVVKGVAIFVSKMIEKMKQLKKDHPDVEEIKIVGLKSVHVDCDLDNETWHGINVGIVTDKLIVDDVTESEQTLREFCWDVSGKNAANQQKGEPPKPGESGGNVHVDCNEIVNGQKWTIVSDGGDGSSAYKWTKEEFEKSFPSTSTGGEEAKKTVLKTLQEILQKYKKLPEVKRTRGEKIKPGHEEREKLNRNFASQGTTKDGSGITALFYKGKKRGQTLFSIRGGKAGQGGYGGKIEVNIGGESPKTSGMPSTGKYPRRSQLLATDRLGVYEASCPNGNIGKLPGDVAFIHKDSAESGDFYGFEEDMKIILRLGVENKPTKDTHLYVKYEDEMSKNKNYAILSFSEYSARDLKVVNAIKKKAVIRQSLVRHLDQIDERKQLTESIEKMLFDPTKHHSNSIDEIINVMGRKVQHQLQTQRQPQQSENREQYVKPALDSSRVPPKPKIIGRRPVGDKTGIFFCLDVLPTEDGIDSLLHCLFGQLNSEGKYFCKNTNKIRNLIAEKSSKAPQNGSLERDEMKISAEILDGKIIVYEYDGRSFFKHKKTVDSKYGGRNAYFILYEGNSRWKKLSRTHNLKLVYKEYMSTMNSLYEDEHSLEAKQGCNTTYFKQLTELISINGNEEITTSVEKLDPQNNTPDKLSHLLFSKLKNDVANNASAICSVAKWVDYYNSRNVSPLFYLHVVETTEDPYYWECEFLLLEMEDRLGKPWKTSTEREDWRSEERKHLMSHARRLSLLTEFATKKDESDILFSLHSDKLMRMLEVFEKEECGLIRAGVGQLSPIDFFYKERSTFWEKKVDDWLKVRPTKGKVAEFVNFLLDLDFKNVIENEAIEHIYQKTFFPGENSASKSINFEEIIAKIKEKDPKNKEIELKLEMIKYMIKKSQLKRGKFEEQYDDQERQKCAVKYIKKKHKYQNLDRSYWRSMQERFIGVFDYAVELKMGFQLRDTQKVAIITLLSNGYMLAQVSTGEGKSIIVAGVAIGFALLSQRDANNKVDVITSNDVLALRDSNLPVAQGGLKELYEFFDVTVGHNCSKSVDERKKAYNMDVVYGQLSNFQRDHLLDKFYNRNIRGDRMMEYAIIDEVDCMLLDRGNNMLYLSHDIPGMEMLESLYVFIWKRIRDDRHTTTAESREDSIRIDNRRIKSEILYDLYGQIAKEDLKNIHAQLGQMESERTAIWEHLTEKEVIDQQGRLLINEVGEITEEKFNYKSTNASIQAKTLNPKMVFYFRTIAERERQIRIPRHLLDFVDRHLDTWLDNAWRALELKQDVDYVIDHDRSDSSPDLNPQVIIIDPETGTDQSSSQWGGALHQFLQLKEGCKLTLQGLKAVFISNATYIMKYKKFAGVSGTLGSLPEQDFLKTKYKCEFITIPTAFPRRYSLKPPKILKKEESWWEAITQETRTIIQENRSIAIFCRSIEEVNQVHKKVTCAIDELRNNTTRIHRYTREYEKFAFEHSKLDAGHVIVATNLAGRGTDIKISETLKNNGGLHICLTNFPDNERVEEQAMGRAARKGEPGSGILILCEKPTARTDEESGNSEEWGIEKMFVMKEIRGWKERQRISRLEKDFKHIEMLEALFESYTDDFSDRAVKEKFERMKKEKNQCKNEIVQLLDDEKLRKDFHESILDKWALWLDETDYDLEYFGLKRGKFELKELIDDFPNWMTRARRVNIAKHLLLKKSENTKKEATNILRGLLSKLADNFFYPAAFYYLAFILLDEIKGEGEEKIQKTNEFIRTLRQAETFLNDHIEMQISFSLIHQFEKKDDQSPSFCPVDGYKEQKENNMKILQYFLSSIQWLLGNYCSISDLREAGSDTPVGLGFFAKYLKKIENFINNKTENEDLKNRKIRLEKVDEYFRELIKSKCIACKLNDLKTIPYCGNEDVASSNTIRKKIIEQIANNYGVNATTLEEKLKSVFNKPRDEKKIEKKLEKENLIPCTRKAFWKKMVDDKALIPPKEWQNMKCVIISEEQLEKLQPELDKQKAITLDFGASHSLHVLYKPTYERRKELDKDKKLVFSKDYVTGILSPEYREKKKLFEFESNQIAQLDLDKLKDVNLESFGRLGFEDLSKINIAESEHKTILDELRHQKVINEQNLLVQDFDFNQVFSYPDCPAYADNVMRLVRKKFLVEIVRQQWLKSKDQPQCLKAIILLPCKPYRDMLGDLMAAHVISGARVSDISVSDLQEEVNKIAEYDEERKYIMEFLTNRRAVYAEKIKTPEFFLTFVNHDIKSNNAIGFAPSELYVFSLGGFDHIIDIKDQEWTPKRIFLEALRALPILTVGFASIGVGVIALIPVIPLIGFKLPYIITYNLLFMGGVSDIMYVVETILTRKNFTWADYGRQRIRSLTGKMDLIDCIKDVSKLPETSNQSFRDSSKSEHSWRKTEDQNQLLKNTSV